MPPDRAPVTTQAYVGLGSNLDDPQSQVRRGLRELDRIPATRLVASSGLYRTLPVGGPAGQPDYVNAVARVETSLGALDLLRALQAIETASGRRREERWGPRPLDLDLLLFGEAELDIPGLLQVPHPRMAERAFVLVPLSEVAPTDLRLPGIGLLSDLLARVGAAGVRRLEPVQARG